MTPLITTFFAGLLTVFCAAFQSRCVNSGQHLLATLNSFLIAITQALVWRAITTPSSGWLEILTYGLSGAVGVNLAMHLHRKTLR
jgi:hypothetical protein